jgi:hypothetical protein
MRIFLAILVAAACGARIGSGMAVPKSRQHSWKGGLRIFMAILLAVVCGLLMGSCSAVLKFRQHPWKGGLGTPPPASGGRLEVDRQEFNFGGMDVSENGTHEFVFTNRGDQTLILNTGSSSCSCTISEIEKSEVAPGQSTKVAVKWRSKHHVGRFQQNVTVETSDPLRREVTLTIKGEYTRSVYADPEELTFGQISGTAPVTQEARILCTLPNQQIKIKGYQMSDPTLEKFFQVDNEPLGADELRKHQGITSGVLVRVTVKPGLPLGRFQQRILLDTNLTTASEIDLPLFGTVGTISLVGPGWHSETNVLDIGAVDGHKVTQRRLVVLGRGPNAKEMKLKIASVEPDFLKVKLGKTTVEDTGDLSQTELLIEIPERKVLADYMGGKNGKFGEILLEAIQPEVHALRIRVRFAVVGGN